jgi:hypothetical protein
MRTDGEGDSPPFVLTPSEYSLVAALVEAVIPPGGDPLSEPGGKEVGAHNYFDSRLCELPGEEREKVRRSLRALNDRATENFGRKFEHLTITEREAVLRSLLASPETRTDFFELRALCLEGFYSDYRDPWYGGKTAWQLTGFGGKRIDGVKKDWSFLRIYAARKSGGTTG